MIINLTYLFASIALCGGLIACTSNSPRSLEVSGSRDGYYAEPTDFVGVNFKIGEPQSGTSLTEALAGDRDKKALVEDLALFNRVPAETILRVEGHTDSVECDEAACAVLSARRAQALHDWLVANGVSEERLEPPKGFGSTRPVDDNSSERGRARNRRAYVSVEGLH